MPYYKNSLILSSAIRFADYLTQSFRGGLFHSLFAYTREAYRNSATARLLSGAGFTEREWENSGLYKATLKIADFIPDFFYALCRGPGNRADPGPFSGYISRVLGQCALPVLGLMTLLMLTVPQEYWNNLYSLGITVFALALFYAAGAGDRVKRIDLKAVGPWPVIFAFITLTSLLWSIKFSMSVRFFFLGLACMIEVALITSAARETRDLMRLIRLVAIGLFISGLYALYQNRAGVEADEILTDLSLFAAMPGRVFSFFENPNSYADILVFFVPLMLTTALFSPKPIQKICFGAVFALCCAALLMTYSRGGYLALAFAMLALMLMLCPGRIPFIIVLSLISVPFLPASILNRLTSIFSSADSSTYTRGFIYSAMIRIIGKNPVIGVGLGSDALKYAIAVTGVYKAQAVFIHAHNIYFQIWAEMGIFGLISFVCVMFFTMRTGLRRIKTCRDPILKGIIAGCVSGLAGSLVFGVTDYVWSYPRVMTMFWFVFAILSAAVKLCPGSDEQS